MSSILDPVGRHPRSVYWRRRLVLLVGMLLVVVTVVRCAGGADGAEDDRPTPVEQEAPDDDASAEEQEAAGADEAEDGEAASAAADRPPMCADDEVSVTARPLNENYGTGSAVDIRFVVSTTGDADCRRDVGAAANEVIVRSGDQVVWTSDRCSPGGAKDVRRLGPDDSFAVTVRWDGSITPEGCPPDRLPAEAGEYQVTGRNADVEGPAADLTLG